jgi:pimeloyl-ACP methyl ester carboxylesterase
VIADGSVLLAEGNLIRRLTPAGGTGALTFGAGLSPDNCWASADALDNVVYGLDSCTARIYRFDLATGAPIGGPGFNGVFRQWTQAELDSRNAYPSRIHLYRFGDAPNKRVIWVHGINRSSQNLDLFGAVLSQVGTVGYPGILARFDYYQDSSGGPGCLASIPAISPQSAIGSVVDSHGGNSCDSNSDSDMVYNTLLLDQYIREQYSESGNQKVVIIAHSMGATIVRGILKYSTETGGEVANTMIDSVIFIAGAHDGSWAARPTALGNIPGIGGLLESLAAPVGAAFGFDPTRPAVHQLRPGSAWYGWANSWPSLLPTSFNVYGDIRFTVGGCMFGSCFDIPGAATPVGDGLLLTGSDDPFASAPDGGARFKRSGNSADAQWGLVHTLRWSPTGTNALDVAKLVADVATAPEWHLLLHTDYALNAVTVTDCSNPNGPKISLTSQLLLVLAGRLGATNYACPWN